MNKSISLSIILIISSFSIVFAQKNINSYKYIIVQKQFEFQKSPDQYQLNSLTKFLFNREGFTAFLEDEKFPADLANNRCLALIAKVNDNSGFLNTKTNIDLFDCNNNKVFSTADGRTKEKDYKRAYQEAIRKAFKDIEGLNYKYDESQIVVEENIVKKPIMEKPIKVEESNKIVNEEREEEVPVPVVEKIVSAKNVENPVVNTSQFKSIKGVFSFDKWGNSKIISQNEYFVVVSGDENFELATIYKTSKPNIYIIKWNAYKQPQLVEIDNEGNLKIDSDSGVKIYERVN